MTRLLNVISLLYVLYLSYRNIQMAGYQHQLKDELEPLSLFCWIYHHYCRYRFETYKIVFPEKYSHHKNHFIYSFIECPNDSARTRFQWLSQVERVNEQVVVASLRISLTHTGICNQ